jgi:hypothetical protein
VPIALRSWFVVHFVLDLAFAIPLFVAPEALLGALGWPAVDPISARMVAAALFGIGTESLLMRRVGAEAFRVMLRFKCLWSGAALVGLGWALARGAPVMVWGFFAIFAGFTLVWNYYRRLLDERVAKAQR